MLTRATSGHPASRASFSSARVFDEFAEPMTTTASQRLASSISADWRFVVAKQRSLRPGAHTSGKRSRTATATSPQSRCDSVVWASSATGCSKAGRASTSATLSTRLIDVGRDGHRADRLLVALVADVDDAVALAGADLRTSWWTFVTSGHTESTT